MITDNNPPPPGATGPFRPGQILRADDLNKLADGVNRAGRLLGGGRLFAGGTSANPTAFVPTTPAVTKGFWGRIAKPIGSSADYTDERYFVFRLRATGGLTEFDPITTEDDEPPKNIDDELNETWPITATNRAEKQTHTHLLKEGTEVWVTSETDYSETPTVHYSFLAGSIAEGSGQYTGQAHLTVGDNQSAWVMQFAVTPPPPLVVVP